MRTASTVARRFTLPAAGWKPDDSFSAVLIALSILFALSPFAVAMIDAEFLPYATGFSLIFTIIVAVGLLAWACDRHSRSFDPAN